MRKLLASKKGQIPTTDILTNIINGIRSFISWFIAVIPKPLLAVIFLFFILFLANFTIPLFSNALGYHCDTNGQVWKVSEAQILTNFDLYRHKPDLEAPNYVDIPLLCGGSGRTATPVATCSNCSLNNTEFGRPTCAGDGYRLDNYGFFLNLECNWIGCAPEVDYFYNYSEDRFQCFADWCINRTLNDYNNALYESEGATPIYMDEGDNRSVTQMIYFKCQNENPTNIRLTLFGIDIFNYKIWVALLVIGALLYVISLKK